MKRKLIILLTGLMYIGFIYSQNSREETAYEIYKQYTDSLLVYGAAINEIAEERMSKLTKTYALEITDYYSSKNYNSYDFHISFENTSKKIIKYITISVTPYNSVGDISGETKILKGVGPIESEGFGLYHWDMLWYKDLVEYVKINSIKIEYTDKTFKTIYKSEIESSHNDYCKKSRIFKFQRDLLNFYYTEFLFKRVEPELRDMGYEFSFITSTLRPRYINENGVDYFEFALEYINNLDILLKYYNCSE